MHGILCSFTSRWAWPWWNVTVGRQSNTVSVKIAWQSKQEISNKLVTTVSHFTWPWHWKQYNYVLTSLFIFALLSEWDFPPWEIRFFSPEDGQLRQIRVNKTSLSSRLLYVALYYFTTYGYGIFNGRTQLAACRTDEWESCTNKTAQELTRRARKKETLFITLPSQGI